jgi:hypothetical protein
MLTDPGLLQLIGTGQLVSWQPPPGLVVVQRRHLLMEASVATAVNQDPWVRGAGELGFEARQRRDQFYALLARFLAGDHLSPQTHVKVLQPTSHQFRDLLEVRSGPPDPQTRLFGYVFQPGCWIATGFHLREDLGDKGDPRWLIAAAASQSIWSTLFGSRAPHRAHYPCDSKAKLKALSDG